MRNDEHLMTDDPMPVSEELIEETGFRAQVSAGKRLGRVVKTDRRSRGILYDMAEQMTPDEVEWYMHTMDRWRALEAEGRKEEARFLFNGLWAVWKNMLRRIRENSGDTGDAGDLGRTGSA